MIIGGGAFRSDTLSQQNAAILTADRSGLAQVIVSNPNPQGHGVWVESGNPVIREISLVSNRHTGIYVAGGAPIIEGNNFFQNQIAGLVLYGNSRAVVRGNQFESTGTAIAVADTATPEIVNNRIVGNDEGIVLLGNARPQVADNSMVQNRRNGVVEVATRSPVAVPSNNAPIASRQALQSDLAPRQTAPTTSPLIAPEPAPQAAEIPPPKPPALPPLPARTASLPAPTVSSPPPPVSEQPVSLPADSATPFPAATTSAPSLAALRRGLTSPATADPVSRTEATEPVAAPDPVATATPISIASLRNRRAVARSGESSPTPVSATTASLPRQTGAVEIPVIPAPAVPPVNQSARLPDLPTLTANTNRLQVPNSTIPLGSGSGANLNLAALALPDGSSPPPPPSRAAVLGLHYRVFVEGSDESTQAKLRTLVPDAFRTRYEGRMVMQAGAFPDQATAEERVQLLLDNGLEARLEYTP
jgi:parallel beta-helix repeat protein